MLGAFFSLTRSRGMLYRACSLAFVQSKQVVRVFAPISLTPLRPGDSAILTLPAPHCTGSDISRRQSVAHQIRVNVRQAMVRGHSSHVPAGKRHAADNGDRARHARCLSCNFNFVLPTSTRVLSPLNHSTPQPPESSADACARQSEQGQAREGLRRPSCARLQNSHVDRRRSELSRCRHHVGCSLTDRTRHAAKALDESLLLTLGVVERRKELRTVWNSEEVGRKTQ